MLVIFLMLSTALLWLLWQSQQLRVRVLHADREPPACEQVGEGVARHGPVAASDNPAVAFIQVLPPPDQPARP
ncbi:hypothetical protein D8I35_01065 [Corticibacter populi]|uniref:Uncharacterized protein n=1 Tax=Corticibacter populi TaxID=1550736 RepID=A0A3M6QXM2_9BURK|nr:hypothetical protein [Corticibacter populi]RMX07758.1 hypothetical protein D8I35_01065 [Corticibacter populi]RZS34980.1 hypothetical protein EV687_0032 [Corticibacter populi]